MNERINPEEAARALAEVRRRREQVTVLAQIPRWFRWAVALLAIAAAVALDTGRSLLIGVGLAVFTVGLLAAVAAVIGRGWSRATPRRDLLGPRGGLVIAAFVVLILLVNLSTAVALNAAGSPLPATAGAVVGAVVIVVIGPLIARYLHRLATDGEK
jgi:hypothetical protein